MGPLGFTLTNSTWTLRPAPTSALPNEGPESRTVSVCRASQAGFSVKLMKPGLATSTLSTDSSWGISAAIIPAISMGFLRIGRASFRARLHE